MEETLRVNEVARILQVTEWTVRKLLRRGHLKGFKMKGMRGWRIRRADLTEFMEGGGVNGGD